MKVVVTGGTGTVGSQVVRELLGRGAEVTVPTRSPERLGALPEGVRGVLGDLARPATVRNVFDGADAVFLLNPVATTELHEGLMALNGALESGVRRLVYQSAHHVDALPRAPHFGSKLAIEAALRASDLEWTILRPKSFFQNDLWLRQPITEYGVYPQPLGDVGASRVDARDIGEAAAVALTEDGHVGAVYELVGSEVWTGARSAAAWAETLGREVRYAGDDLDAWEQQQLAFLPDWMVYDFRLMFEHIQRHGLLASEEAHQRQETLLGRAPRRFEDFVRETAEAWSA